MTELARLHRRLLTAMGFSALVAFLAGAGFETPFALVAAGALGIALIWEPSEALHIKLEWVWRALALLLAARAVYFILTVPEDVVLPLVDVLLVLLASEALRPTGTTDRTRMYTLTFALMVAAAAYRAGVAFGMAFVVYSTAGVVALLVGHMLFEARRFEVRPPRLERPFLLRIAALSSVMLFMSGLLFIAFPRVTRSWVSRGAPVRTNVIGFSDRVSLAEHGGTLYANPEVVLRVEFPTVQPTQMRTLYWRGRSYDYFDGQTWWHSPRANALAVPGRWYRENWPPDRLRPTVYAAPLDVPVLFSLHPTLDIKPQSRMRWLADQTGDIWYDAAGPPIYSVLAPADQPPDSSLPSIVPSEVAGEEAYLQLPPLSPAVRRLADSLVAGADSQIERVRAIEKWLRTDFRYTLDLPSNAREAELEHFLFRRKAGHCEYFSSAMVMLLRNVGIPARNVNGFLGGEWNAFGNYLTVGQNNAHSWVEVWFPRYGWLQFDPTPAGSGGVAAQQRTWLGPLRFIVDGLEHRWNKWVLEYNLEAQIGVFRRVADTFTAVEPSGARRPRFPIRAILPYAFAIFALVVAIRLVLRKRSGVDRVPASVESGIYLRLRRAYHRAGYGDERQTPLGFTRALERARAPAHTEAAELVRLYLACRFGGEDIGVDGRARMRRVLETARAAIRAARKAA